MVLASARTLHSGIGMCHGDLQTCVVQRCARINRLQLRLKVPTPCSPMFYNVLTTHPMVSKPCEYREHSAADLRWRSATAAASCVRMEAMSSGTDSK